MKFEKEETRVKTLRFPIDMAEKIEKLAKENQRDFSKQVRFMCEEYMKIKENR